MNKRSEINNIKETYKNLILEWRKTFDGLTDEEKTGIQYIEDLRPPCQMQVVILENKELGIVEQKWIMSHFKDEPDLNITVFGPINSVEASSMLIDAAEAKRFDRPLPEKTWFPTAKTYRDLIESHVLGLIDSFRNSVIQKIWTAQPIKSGIRSKHLISEEVSVWEFQGVLEQKEIRSIVDRLIENIKSNVRRKGQDKASKEVPKRKETKAKGTFIYPHVWVGSRPTHSFEEDMKNRMYNRQLPVFHTDETVIFEKVGKLSWLATQEGLIAVTVEDTASALRLINAFMSLLIMRGNPAFVVRENELAQLNLDPDTGKVLGSHASIVLPRMLPRDISFVRPRWQEESMPIIEVNMIRQIWEDIRQIENNYAALDTLKMFGEVYTHFQRDEYSQAILVAWTIVETWFASAQERISRVEKLTKKRGFSRIKDMIELLETEYAISSDIVSKLYQLRLLRNQVSHSMGNATKEDAKIALETIATILQSGRI